MNLRSTLSACILVFAASHFSVFAQLPQELHQLPAEPLASGDAEATYELHEQWLAAKSGAQRTTATISRLIAHSSNDPGLYDSCYYHYSTNERGDDDGKTMQGGSILRTTLPCDTGIHVRLWGSSSSFVPNQRVLKSFDAQNRELSHTLQNWWNSGWQNGNRKSFWRDAAGRDTLKVTEVWIDASSTWMPSYAERHAYNSSGQITSQLTQDWGGSNGWLNNKRTTTTYDAAGNQILVFRGSWDSDSLTWRNFERWTYTFNSANKLLTYAFEEWDIPTNAWKPNYAALYSYNALNQLTTVVNSSGQTGTLVNTDSIVHISLNAAGQPLTTHAYNRVSGNWSLARRTTNTYTAADLLAVSLVENWNGSAFVNNRRSFTFYNSFDQRTRYYSESWNSAAWVVGNTDRDFRFHYETVTTGIANAPARSVQAYLFPVPAIHQLTLAMHWPTSQRITISLRDVSGKELHHWEERIAAGVYTKELSVEALPTGTYFLRAQGAQDGWSGSFQVVR